MGTGSSDDADRTAFEVDMRPAASELPPARHRFSRWLLGAQVHDDDVAELEVVFSELATNAITAAPGPASRIAARAWLEGATVTLQVTNGEGGAEVDDRRWDLADELRSGGRGLVIVRAFVDSLGIDRTADGTVVITCRRAVRVVRQ